MKSESANRIDTAPRKNATLHDVARVACVSLTTAAGILRNTPTLRTSATTRERVLEVAAQLGYRRNAVAASLKEGKTRLIGVLLPLYDQSTVSHSLRAYPQDLLVAIFQAATQAGLRIIPLSLPTSQEKAQLISSVTDRQVDGLIIGAIYDAEFIGAVEAAGVPCVEISGSGQYVITPDNMQGATQVVEHLVSLGHQRIVHWCTGGGVAATQRSAGFEQAAHRLGIAASIVHDPDQLTRMLCLPSSERPTAIFAFNDYYASLILDIARKMGLTVPKDISVVGFDNNIFAETSRPQLTTVHNPLEEQAAAAVNLLLSRFGDSYLSSVHIAIPTRLVVRESTAIAPSTNRKI